MAGSAALLAGYAVQISSFFLLCLATFMVGVQGAFLQQYRFAAIESVPPDQAGRAVSFVLLGGIVAAFLGPELAVRASEWIPGTTYRGSFLAMALLYGAAAIALIFYQEGNKTIQEVAKGGRSLRVVASQPAYQLAVLTAAASYGVMTFVMTATPVHLSAAHGFSLGTTSNVIKSHIAAMYIPSLFTGYLIDRLGLHRIMVSGALILLVSGVIGATAENLPAYYAALMLLGLGWNFLFVGATVLLTRTYTPVERFRAQALNDFSVFGVRATASLSAGAVLQLAGWSVVNVIGFSLLLITLGLFIRSRRILQVGATA